MRTLLSFVLGFGLIGCGGRDQQADQSTSRLGACGETPAPALFEHALCICEDFDEVGLVQVGPGRDRPSIAVNGMSRSVTASRIEGDWHAYGGLSAAAALAIEGDLTSGSDVDWVGDLDVDGGLAVGGDLRGAGRLNVGGDLAVAGERVTLGVESIGGVGAYSDSGPPCGCDAQTFLDVPALVEIARTENDNDARGIRAGELFGIGDIALTLDTGRYYFEDVATIGRTRLTIAGAVSIYLDGKLAAIGDDMIEILPGASLDLYVSGAVGSVGRIRIGDEDDPSAFRLYVGGDDAVQLGVGVTRIAGTIYAPEARIAWVGDTEVKGAVFARHLDGVGRLDVRYTRPTEVEVDPKECPEPVEPVEPVDQPMPEGEGEDPGEDPGIPDV